MKAPRFWESTGTLSSLLTPVAILYQVVAGLRQRLTSPTFGTVPVICVGNVVVGGAGKTPFVRYLAQLCNELSFSKIILTRGYGGKITKPVRVDTCHFTSVDTGDEALLLSSAGETWISRKRREGITAISGAVSQPHCILMDDGLQNPTIAKTASLLVVDGGYGLGNGRTLPAGPLREPWDAALARVEGVLIIGEDRHGIAAQCGGRPILRGRLVPLLNGLDLASGRWLAFAGIGRPGKFFETLKEAGAELAGCEAFADHYPYRVRDLERLAEKAHALQARLITTEKDAVRLPESWRERISVLPVKLELAPDSREWLKQQMVHWCLPR